MCYKKIIFPALGMVTILTMGALGMQPDDPVEPRGLLLSIRIH